MEKVLLHSCCAPCSGAVLEWMLANGVQPVVFFSNSNIFPRREYEKRRDEVARHCERLGVAFIEDAWDHEGWLAAVRGLEDEPERGRRCEACFALRLARAAQKCEELGIARFATTLASSRWKSLEQVDAAGAKAEAARPGAAYWAKNWRKGGLQARRGEIIKAMGFYNQQWCGCEFSARDRLLYGMGRGEDVSALEAACGVRIAGGRAVTEPGGGA